MNLKLETHSSENSNVLIYNLVKDNTNFSLSRIGLGGESLVTYMILNNQYPNPNQISMFFNNAGFYGSENFELYAEMYRDAIQTSDIHAYWGFPGFVELENFLLPKDKVLIDPGSLESFKFDKPWTSNFKGKKILIISPFKLTIDKQLLQREKLWENKEILPNTTYITYQSVQSIGGKGPHKDWYDSFRIMCGDISNIDFDIALLGCGAYGLPLVGYIKNQLKKSAVYVGGGLQLYFGILGKRWEDNPDFNRYANHFWTRPSIGERPNTYLSVEGGCYW